MRAELRRVNIVLPIEQHERFKKYAREHYSGLSDFLRNAGENEILQKRIERIVEKQIAPLIQEIKKLRESMEE